MGTQTWLASDYEVISEILLDKISNQRLGASHDRLFASIYGREQVYRV